MINKYDIAAAATIADIEGKPQKLSATKQREIFGAYVFGKQTVTVDTLNQGQVEVKRRAFAAGLVDHVFGIWTLDQVADAVNNGRKLRA